MKKLGLIAISLVIGFNFISCSKETCMDGDGYPRAVVRELEDFKAVNVRLSAVVELVSDTAPFVEMVLEENVEPHIATVVINETLDISLGFCFSSHANIKIRVHYDSLNTIITSGPGDVFSKTIMLQDDLNLLVNSSGDINITTNLENLHSTIKGTGIISVNGQIKNHFINHNNSGTINTYQAVTDSVIVDGSGTGNCYLRVSNSLTANLSGKGSLFYKGHPDVTENNTGTGKLINDN